MTIEHSSTPTDPEALNDTELRALLAQCQAELGRRSMSSLAAAPTQEVPVDRRVEISDGARANMLPEDEDLIQAFYTEDADTGDYVLAIDESDD